MPHMAHSFLRMKCARFRVEHHTSRCEPDKMLLIAVHIPCCALHTKGYELTCHWLHTTCRMVQVTYRRIQNIDMKVRIISSIIQSTTDNNLACCAMHNTSRNKIVYTLHHPHHSLNIIPSVWHVTIHITHETSVLHNSLSDASTLRLTCLALHATYLSLHITWCMLHITHTTIHPAWSVLHLAWFISQYAPTSRNTAYVTLHVTHCIMHATYYESPVAIYG